jgi:hypothetical protein
LWPARKISAAPEDGRCALLYGLQRLMFETRRQLGPVVAALLALAMLSYASVQSIVMQAAASTPARLGAFCGSGAAHAVALNPMAYGSPWTPADQGSGHMAGHHAACPYCAAAANPPMGADCTPIRVPTAVAFVTFRNVAAHGPRGPPAAEPRARGPPPILTPA